MPDSPVPDPVAGKTLRFTWTGGPTKGETHEHVFNTDGSVDYRKVEGGKASAKSTHERKYAALRVTDTVCVVSYLAASGFTLTVAIDLAGTTIAGFASNDKQWFPVRGTYRKMG